MSFAKLFGSGDDQVLIIRKDNDDDVPAIVIMYDHKTHTASLTFTIPDVVRRDRAFDQMTEDAARAVIADVLGSLGGLGR